MNYLLFANQITGAPILKQLRNNPPSVVITFINNKDNWKRILLRIIKGKTTIEDRLRFLYKIELYDYYSLTPKRLSKILKKHNIEIGFITTFSKIIPDNILNQFPKGVFNLHPSLLPNHGGANPFFWIIYNNDEITGTTCHQATSKLDEGLVIFQTKYKVLNKNSLELYKKYIKDCKFIINTILNNYEELSKRMYALKSKTIFDPKIPSLKELSTEAKTKSDKKRINKALKLFKKKI